MDEVDAGPSWPFRSDDPWVTQSSTSKVTSCDRTITSSSSQIYTSCFSSGMSLDSSLPSPMFSTSSDFCLNLMQRSGSYLPGSTVVSPDEGLSLSQRSGSVSQGSIITSPDEGFDDVDCGMSFSSYQTQDSGTSLQDSRTSLQDFKTSLLDSGTSLQDSITSLQESITSLQDSRTSSESRTFLQDSGPSFHYHRATSYQDDSSSSTQDSQTSLLDSGTSMSYFQQSSAFDNIYREDTSSGRSFQTDSYNNNDDKTSLSYLTIQPAELALILKAGFDKYLLIDSRSFLEYNTSHIQQSANVCCSKLVKRRLQRDKVHIKDFLTQTCHIDIDEFLDVIVYDQCTECPEILTEDNFLCVLLSKLSTAFTRVAILKGGFLAFQAMYPSLCESKTNSYRCAALTSLSQPCLPVSNVGPTRILPFLYLGSQQDALSPDIVQVNEITYVLNVSTTCMKPSFIPDGHFLRIPVNDNYSAKLLPYFEQAFQFLDKVREANGCCLVHCLAGISRSPTLAIAYIMKYLNMSSDDAYRYVKDKRPTISPNFNFLGQLLEFEKQIKQQKESNGNNNDGCHSDNTDPPSNVLEPTNMRNAMTMSCPSISMEETLNDFSPPKLVSRNLPFQRIEKFKSQGHSDTTNIKQKGKLTLKTIESCTNETSGRRDDVIKTTAKHSVTSFKLKTQTVSTESPTVRPNVLSLGIDTSNTCRRLPLSFTRESSMVPSKSLTDITETSETPSPIVSTNSRETIYPTSCFDSNTQNVKPLLSPFPCGETTVSTFTEDQNFVPYSGNLQRLSGFKTTATTSQYSSVVTSEKSKLWKSDSISSSQTGSISEPLTPITPVTPDTQSATSPFSFSGQFLKAGGKRPLRSSLSLSLSPIAPQSSSKDSSESGNSTSFAPSACKIEKKLSKKSHTPDVQSYIPKFTCPSMSPSASPGSVTMSHIVKLKSFNLSASLPLHLSAQSPTTSLAKLHFGSAENSDSECEASKMDTSDYLTTSLPLKKRDTKQSSKSLNESLEKLSSFPSTSLDKLSFTPCYSSSNENLSASSPRTSGVKRPLHNDISEMTESIASSHGLATSTETGGNIMSASTSSQQKVVVRKREGRSKRSLVRPNSIAFSSYPTFDLGSDCQDSPNSASSSTSQDDTSELYSQNGKKSKPSDYMTDVRFRLGRYSEREVYRQITAAMEAAMMKSQSFDANRKSRSLDDILSSEDDSSAPNSPKLTRMNVPPPML
ncbi:Dual specificity protein phosphatase 16 [Mactra antiquata]